jgi:RHS repeat-associated protein
VNTTVSDVTTPYLYDGQNPAMISSNQLLAGTGLDEIYAQINSTGTTSYLRDGVNSTVADTNSSAATTANYFYSPYGDTASTGTPSTTLRFTSRENDGATGLYYYRARYYSPQLGRFISEDPIGLAAGTNYYAYGNGNPISLTDPLGLFSGTEAVVGFGDGVSRVLSFGLWSTADYRAAHDIGSIDMCSASYRGGKYFGWAWGGVTLWSAGLVPKPNAVFWRGGGRAAALAAGNTIQDTFIGGVLTGFGVTNEYVWAAASAPYAANAVGVATVYVGEGGGWISAMEMWILEARGLPVVTVF